MNSVSVSKSLYRPILSAVAANPRIETPLWTDEGETPVHRWLPVRAKDLLWDGDYASTVELDQADVLVCSDCRRHFRLQRILTELPRLRILVFESHTESEFLKSATLFLTKHEWGKEAELVLGSPDLEQKYRSHNDVVRHILLFTKKEQSFSTQ